VLLSLFSTGADKTYTASAPAAGTYYLAVDVPSYYYNGGSYNLTANHTPGSTAGFESEPNDSIATADALALGTPITGQLSSSTDQDVYKLTVSAAGTFSLIFDVPTNDAYSNYFRLHLYDSAGVLLSLFSTGHRRRHALEHGLHRHIWRINEAQQLAGVEAVAARAVRRHAARAGGKVHQGARWRGADTCQPTIIAAQAARIGVVVTGRRPRTAASAPPWSHQATLYLC
jgi:hypothetical protein